MRIFAPLKGPDGEIGRHATLRGWCRYRCASSSLVLGTTKKETFSRSLFLLYITEDQGFPIATSQMASCCQGHPTRLFAGNPLSGAPHYLLAGNSLSEAPHHLPAGNPQEVGTANPLSDAYNATQLA